MTAKRLTVVVNPCGGTRRGLSILDQVKPVFSQARLELDVCVTKHAGHAREIARTLSRQRESSLCVIGGDGTIHEVVSGLMERGEPVSVPLGIIPGGTGNDVAKQLGIATAMEAAQRIVAGRTCPLDVMRVDAEGRTDYCVTIVGWAGVGDINARAERLRRLGPPRYAFAALWQILFPKRHRARVVLDGRSCWWRPATRSIPARECSWRRARKWMTARWTS
jgi:diacylglycerol kinase family enzyme